MGGGIENHVCGSNKAPARSCRGCGEGDSQRVEIIHDMEVLLKKVSEQRIGPEIEAEDETISVSIDARKVILRG